MLNELVNQECICKVTQYTDKNDNEKYGIIRIADIVEDDIFEFIPIQYENQIFDNRTFFPLRVNDNSTVPIQNGFIGVWKCTAIKNNNNPDKDYYYAEYCSDRRPIPVIEKNVASVEELVKSIREQIIFPANYKAMLVSFHDNGNWYGIFLETSRLTRKDGKYSIPDNVSKLTLYHFTSNEVIPIEDMNFLSHMHLNSLESEFISAKDFSEVVKEQLLNQITWSALQQKGYTRDQYITTKSIVASLNVNDVVSNVKKTVNCSEDKAKIAVDKFIENINQYLNADSLEDAVLKSLYARDEQLRTRLTGIAQAEWEAETAEKQKEIDIKLNEAYVEIDGINKEVKEKEKTVQQLCKTAEEKQKDINELSCLKERIEAELAEKLKNAKNDFAAVINQYPMISSFVGLADNTRTVRSEKLDTILVSGKVLNDTEDLTSEIDVVDLIHYNLIQNGLETCAYELSSLMYACCILSVPVCLAGPHGKLIADIFSASVHQKTAAVLNCSGNICEDDYAVLQNEKIVIVQNAFNSAQKDEIIERLSEMKSFFIYLMPFAEDLQIEPVGILNYMVPVFTENLFSSIPDGSIVAGRKKGNWKKTDPKGIENGKIDKVFRKMGCSSYLKSILSKVVPYAKSLLMNQDDNLEYLLIAQSYAYVMNKPKELRKCMKSANLTSDVKEILETYCGDEDDD